MGKDTLAAPFSPDFATYQKRIYTFGVACNLADVKKPTLQSWLHRGFFGGEIGELVRTGGDTLRLFSLLDIYLIRVFAELAAATVPLQYAYLGAAMASPMMAMVHEILWVSDEYTSEILGSYLIVHGDEEKPAFHLWSTTDDDDLETTLKKIAGSRCVLVDLRLLLDEFVVRWAKIAAEPPPKWAKRALL